MASTPSEKRAAGERQSCIWMQAEVVSRKFCKINYHCPSCGFDRFMRRMAEENRILKQEGKVPEGEWGEVVSWKENLRSRPPSQQPCLHHMKGRIEFRACTNDYICGNCEFDQYFSDQYSVHAVVSPVDVLQVKGFGVPQGYYFHRGHTWVKIEEGSTVRVGIDEFAMRLLGPLDRIEVPLMGKEVRQGSADINISREAHHAKVLSPVSGVVTGINLKLRENANLVNQDPYTEGWVMSVHSKDLRKDLKKLMLNRETGDFMGEEVDRLYDVIEDVAGPLAADGGYLGNDIYGQMPGLGWERLTRVFLKS